MNDNWRIETTAIHHVRSTANGAENECKGQEGWITKYSRYSWTVKRRQAQLCWEILPHDGADDRVVRCKYRVDRQDL